MIDEDHLTDLDMSEVVDDTDQYFNSENQGSEVFDTEISNVQNSEDFSSEGQSIPEKKTPNSKPEIIRSTKLPMARIKNIMKMDPDVSIVSADAVFLVTKATVLEHNSLHTDIAAPIQLTGDVPSPLLKCWHKIPAKLMYEIIWQWLPFLLELFLETIAKETYAHTATSKRKTIAKKDFDLVINKVDCLCFLEGAMDF